MTRSEGAQDPHAGSSASQAGRPSTSLASRLGMLLLGLVLAPLAGELLLRASFLIDSSPSRRPELYADWFSDDDYWRLHLRWDGRWKPEGPDSIHPLLGWSQGKITKENPLGLAPDNLEKLLQASDRRKLLFYGDSFVGAIPERVQAGLAAADVVNLGVGGYGTGQVYLLMRETYRLAPRPFLIVGLMSYDVDRAILSVRTSKKPRLIISHTGRLSVTNTPIESDLAAFFRAAPLDLDSYLLALLRTRFGARRGQFGADPKRAEKEQLNARIIQEMVALARAAKLEILFVIFVAEASLWNEDWRVAFLETELTSHNVPFLSTRPALLARCQAERRSFDTLYRQDGHYTEQTEQLVAEALLPLLARSGIE